MEVVYSRKITLSFGYDTGNGKVVSMEGGMSYGLWLGVVAEFLPKNLI
jgi:hypothetical protein